MSSKTFINIVTAVFVFVAIFHGLRVVLLWELSINGWEFPFWLSILVVLLTSFLALFGQQSKS